MVVDTNIFIDLLKGNEKAKHFFETKENLSTSIIVVMEVAVGLKKKGDIKQFEKFLAKARITVFPLTESISMQAYSIFSHYFHATSIGILDSFIAASAIEYQEKLVTRNIRHFKQIKNLLVVKPY